MKGHVEFVKRYLKGLGEHEKKDSRSDDTKTELFEQNSKHCIWQPPGTAHHLDNTTPTMKHGGGRRMLWVCFSTAGAGKLIRNEGRMNAAKNSEVLQENLPQSSCSLRLGQWFT